MVGVHNFGASDLLEIRLASGGTNVLMPFSLATVPEVDLKQGRLTVVPPEGLIEEPNS